MSEQLQYFWNGYVKPCLGVLGFLFGLGVFVLPAYFIHHIVEDWSDSRRYFLDGLAAAAFLGAVVVGVVRVQTDSDAWKIPALCAFISVIFVWAPAERSNSGLRLTAVRSRY